jgi:hypothetical protein
VNRSLTESAPNITKCAGHSYAARSAPGEPVLQPLEPEATRGVPYEQLAVHRGCLWQLRRRDLRKRSPNSVPRLTDRFRMTSDESSSTNISNAV